MKKLAILNACTPAEEEEFQIYEKDQFQTLFDAVEHNLQLREYRITEGEFPEAPDECDAYLITGSPSGAYEDGEWIKQLIAFIQGARAADKKLVGICFGHQVLAQALGGRAEKSPKGWGLGLQTLEFYDPPAWMAADVENGSGRFYFCHQDQVTRLPPGARLLAGSEFCPNGMYVVDDQVLGLQAHPEFTSQTMHTVLDGLPESLTPVQRAAAAETIKHQTADGQKVARWIVNFLDS